MPARFKRIVVEGPFQPVPGYDQHQVSAVLEAASGTRRLLLTIPGQRRPQRGTSSEEAWQDAMGFLTLLELARRWRVEDLPVENAAEEIHLLDDLDPREWPGVGVEAFVQQRVSEYIVWRTATGWQAVAWGRMRKHHVWCGLGGESRLLPACFQGDAEHQSKMV